MLDSFLKVAYANEAKRELERSAIDLLKKLPEADLVKMAAGEKLAHPGGSFLDKFRETPLFEEAIALEEEELRMEMAESEQQKERRAASEMQDALWTARDALRIRKRLLELELAKQEAGVTTQAQGGATMAPPTHPEVATVPTAGSEAVAPPPPGPEHAPPAPAGASTKTAAEASSDAAVREETRMQATQSGSQNDRISKEASAVLQLGDTLGRELARADAQAKHAAAKDAIGRAAKSLAKSPVGLLAAGGALGGLAGGLRKDEEGKRHALRGAGGALAGATGGAIAGLGIKHLEKSRGGDIKALASGESRRLLGDGAKHAAAKDAIGRAAKSLATNPVGLLAAGGALGGLAGGLRKDEEGKRHALRGAGGALAGAAGGAIAGAGIKHLEKSRGGGGVNVLSIRPSSRSRGEGSVTALGRGERGSKALPPASEKHAADATAIGRAIKAVADRPSLALAGAGGAAGLAHGLRKDESGNRHALRGVGEGLAGAAGGAALGHGLGRLRRSPGAIAGALPPGFTPKGALPESTAKHAAPLLLPGPSRAGVGAAIKGLAGAASRYARNPENLPTLLGAGAAGIGGLGHGLQRDEQGERHVGRGIREGLLSAAAVGALGEGSKHLIHAIGGGGPASRALARYAGST